MDLLYFVILISSLIFVHELGHLLVAKAFGVKVLTFSLGFGPKVLRLRGRETEYCIGVLPLGGYVKMLESHKTDIVLPEDRNRTFESLGLHKRILVVLAGPIMNLLFPVLLYFTVFVGAGPFLPPTVGIVFPDHPADGKLLPGDRVMAVNGQDVGTFEELQRIVERSPAKQLRFTVYRNNEHVEVEVRAEESTHRRELDIVEREGSIGIGSSAPAAVIGVADADSPAYRAGLRTFDVVTHVAGDRVRRFIDLEQAFGENRGETVPVTYRRPVAVPDALGGLAEMAVYESGVVALTPDTTGTDLVSRTGIELADLYPAIVPEDSYLYKAGLRPGDKILRLDDKDVPAWSVFHERLLAGKDRPHRIHYLSANSGRVRSGTFRMRREDITDEYGQTFSRYVLRVRPWIPLAPEEYVDHPTPVRYAVQKAATETVDVTRFILVALVRVMQGRLSVDSFGGPMSLYEIAGQEGRKGPEYLIWVMAFMSVSLGLLNLLPIPVLDGGHLMFSLLEGLMRRPLPMRAREIAHIVGMAILFGLIALAFKNDVENKKWEVIVGQVRELVG
jgi:regulator of sigma E protease